MLGIMLSSSQGNKQTDRGELGYSAEIIHPIILSIDFSHKSHLMSCYRAIRTNWLQTPTCILLSFILLVNPPNCMSDSHLKHVYPQELYHVIHIQNFLHCLGTEIGLQRKSRN